MTPIVYFFLGWMGTPDVAEANFQNLCAQIRTRYVPQLPAGTELVFARYTDSIDAVIASAIIAGRIVVIAGHSFGGYAAVETVKRLGAIGIKVSHLLLLDPVDNSVPNGHTFATPPFAIPASVGECVDIYRGATMDPFSRTATGANVYNLLFRSADPGDDASHHQDAVFRCPATYTFLNLALAGGNMLPTTTPVAALPASAPAPATPAASANLPAYPLRSRTTFRIDAAGNMWWLSDHGEMVYGQKSTTPGPRVVTMIQDANGKIWNDTLTGYTPR